MTHYGADIARKRIAAGISRAALLLASLAFALCASAASQEAAAARALRFARGWERVRPRAEGASVRERSANGRKFHEVAFKEGGFAVVAEDSGSVIAYAPSGELGEDDGGPLWALLKRDLPSRAATGDPQARASASAMSAESADSIADVRVPALVKTKWNQMSLSDDVYCYNYYTPDHAPCGCVATAMAQIMRHYEYPSGDAAVQAGTYYCKSNGTSVALSMLGGTYDWSAMPLSPDESTPDDSRRAIGKICYDAGVSMHMSYALKGSSATVATAVSPLRELFHFANAKTCFATDYGALGSSTICGAIYPSLDAGCPVILGIIAPLPDDKYMGHAVIADGYGYSDGMLYTHLNMGWSGIHDLWYNLPAIDIEGNSFSIINAVEYNIFPTNTGEIVSGRITDNYGRPVAGATVRAVRTGVSTTNTYSAVSNTNGIYALLLPGNPHIVYNYSLTAGKRGMTSETSTALIQTSEDFTGLQNTESGFSYQNFQNMRCGNVWGMDFILTPTEGPHHLFVAADGSDYNDGSEESPFATISAAVEAATDGDSITVGPGVFAPFSSNGKSITITASEGPSVTVIDGQGASPCFVESDATTNTVISGFTLRNGYNAGNGGGTRGGTLVGCTIEQCRAGDCGGGVYGGTLFRCIVVDNYAAEAGGGLFSAEAHSSLIAGNVAGSSSVSMAFGGGASSCELYNCTVSRNLAESTSGSYGGGVHMCNLINTIVYGNEARGVDRGTEERGCNSANSFIGIDPGFADADNMDFSLTPGSCAIDAGAEDCAKGELDLAGNPRVQRETVDAGCYEFPCPIWISPSDTAVNASSHTGTLVVRASGSWTIECDSDWLSLDTSSGSGTASVRYTIAANRTGLRRDASVTATDQDGNQADAHIEQIAAVSYPDWHGGHARYGLFVGINEYDRSFVGKSNWLNGCVPDAMGMHAAFTSPRSFWPAENCTVLTNSAATCAAVRGAIANLAERAESGDTVLIMQSSHGYSEADGSLNAALSEYDTLYFDSQIAADMALFREGVNVIWIVDACNSGGLFKDTYAGEETAFALAESVNAIMEQDEEEKTLYASLMGTTTPSRANIGWITAADYHQKAWDAPNGSGGMFAQAFLEGWSTELADFDGNGYFDFLELFDYAAARATGLYGLPATAQTFNDELLLKTIAGRACRGYRFILR